MGLRKAVLFFVMVSAVAGMCVRNYKPGTLKIKTSRETSLITLGGWSSALRKLAKDLVIK